MNSLKNSNLRRLRSSEKRLRSDNRRLRSDDKRLRSDAGSSARVFCPLADAAPPFGGGAPGAESAESAAVFLLGSTRATPYPNMVQPLYAQVLHNNEGKIV